MNRTLLILTAILFAFSFAIVISCGAGDGVSLEDGEIKGQATIPLLPIDLPIFPTEVNLSGLVGYVEDALDDLGVPDLLQAILDEDDIRDVLDVVENKLEGASLKILDPGVLSFSIDSTITDIVRDYVVVTEVGVTFGFRNQTDVYVDVPVEFQLFLGDGKLAKAWDGAVMIPFVDERVDEDGKFIVSPGEEIELEIPNVPHLVEALNESMSIGIGYKAKYRMADVGNGADPVEAVTEFGLCIAEGLISGSTENCPDIEELLNWHLALTKFELRVKAESDLDIPEIPGCEEFADEFGLDDLKKACP
ncbi:MAG: hypothetical protein P9L99_15580 [Candidatus Lernaella stagnicola]|nr:hypothetical protein [Candidatus Lernaella stagnicola]